MVQYLMEREMNCQALSLVQFEVAGGEAHPDAKPPRSHTKLRSQEVRKRGVEGRTFSSALPHFRSSGIRDLEDAGNRKIIGGMRQWQANG